jgi:hypothetical protein
LKESRILISFLLLLLGGCVLKFPLSHQTNPVDTINPPAEVAIITNRSLNSELTATPDDIHTPTSTVYGYIKPTPQPTLSTELKTENISNFLNSSGSCLFPCYWGITPGSSSVHDLNSSLSPVSDNIFVNYLKDESTESKYVFMYFYEFQYPDNPLRVMRHSYTIVNTIIKTIEADIDMSISSLLNQYGIPSDILIYVTGVNQSVDKIPFSIIFIYDELNFLVFFYDDQGSRSEDTITGCFDQEQGKLYSWAPNHHFRIIEIPEFSYSSTILPIGEVTKTNPEEFVLSSLHSEGEICIETFSEFWD